MIQFFSSVYFLAVNEMAKKIVCQVFLFFFIKKKDMINEKHFFASLTNNKKYRVCDSDSVFVLLKKM